MAHPTLSLTETQIQPLIEYFPMVSDFFPTQAQAGIPALGTSGGTPLPEIVVHARFADTSLRWSWYLLEYDGGDRFFGIAVIGRNAVPGQFSLSELVALAGQGSQRSSIRYDDSFSPIPVKQLAESEPAVRRMLAGQGLDLISLDL